MEKSEKKEYAVALLKKKASQLGRPPKRSDFDSETVCFIKQKLGPWPRALEAAGLKEPPKLSAKDKSRIKRERSRKRRKLAKKPEAVTSENASLKEEQEERK